MYGIPTLELLDGDPVSEEEKAEAGGMYARETLELHEAELLQLRERVSGLEQDVEEALRGRERLERNETQSRQELVVRTQENERLDQELAAQRRLVEQKTGELNKALEGRYQLENELALYKLDYKVDDSRYTDLFLPTFNPDSESSDIEEIPYLGQARFKPNQTVHRTTHRDMSQPAPYQVMPGVQYSGEGSVHTPNPSDPAVLARQVYRKEQEIQTSDRRLEDLRVNLSRSNQNIQTCEDGQGGSPLSDEESERLRARLSAVKEELRELKRRQEEQHDLSQIIGASDEDTASLIRDSEVFESADAEDVSHIAELIAEKEVATREMAQRISGGEQVEVMKLESSTLTEELRRERGQQDKLVADKAQLVTLLNEALNIQGVSAPVHTPDTGELEDMREREAQREQEMQALQEDMERLIGERDGLWRRAHRQTAEVGVSARCHLIDQSTNTPHPRPKLNVSLGSSVSIPSGEQAWVDRLTQLGQDLAEKELVNQVLQDAIDRINLEKDRALQERDQAREGKARYAAALQDAQDQIDELKRMLAEAGDALEGLERVERERATLEERMGLEEQDRHQVEGENKWLTDQANQMNQRLAQSEEVRRGVNNRAQELEEALRGKESEIQELRDYIAQLEDANVKSPQHTQHTQTPAQPNFPQMLDQLQTLIDVIPENGEPEEIATVIQELPQTPPAQFPAERMVGELEDKLVGLLDNVGEELTQLRDQLVAAEAENADLRERMNPTLVNRTTETGPDPRLERLAHELDSTQRDLDNATQEIATLQRYRGVDVSTQVRPRLNNQLSQANLMDAENSELRRQLDRAEGDNENLLKQLERAERDVRTCEAHIQTLAEDVRNLEEENARLAQALRTTVGVQTSEQGEQPPYAYNQLSALGSDVARLQGMMDRYENADPRDGSSVLTESIDLNEFDRRPPHRNVSLQADLYETESRGMQTGGTAMHTQTFPLKESLGTQTHPHTQEKEYLFQSPLDSPLSVSENSVFPSHRVRPPNRTEIRIPERDRGGIHVKSKSTLTRKPGGTGRRREVRDIFIDEEVISSEPEVSVEEAPPLPPPTDRTTRVHYRTTRGAQTEKPKTHKKFQALSDTELHDKIYISKKKRKHRANRTKHPQQTPRHASTQKTFIVFSESESDTESAASALESGGDADYIYVHGKHRRHRHRDTQAGNGGSDYHRIHVRKSDRRPAAKHHYTTGEHEYFCNVPQHAGMEEEIDRLEALLDIPNRRNRSTHVDLTVRHSVLDRLADIERLLKDKVDRLGDKQEEQERLNHQLSREQQHLSRTAAELSRAGNELQQINVQLRGRSQRTDDITGQTSHGGMTPQLDTLHRRIEGLTGILHEAETRGNEEVADLVARKNRLQREITQLGDELALAKRSLQEVNEQKRIAQSDYFRCTEEKVDLEDEIKNLTLSRVKEEGKLRQLRALTQELRSLQSAPDYSDIAALEAKRSDLQSQIRQLQHDVSNFPSQDETMERLRYSQNECEKLKGFVKRYKERIRDLDHQLRRHGDLENSELRAQLGRRQDNRQHHSKHTLNIDQLLHDLQSQLANLQGNISTELYKDDFNLASSQPPPPMHDMLPPENAEVLPDMFSMRVNRHQATLDEINREHESLVQILQVSMQEGEKNVLAAQQETMHGVVDLKQQIEQLQAVLNQHQMEPPPDSAYQMELDMKRQSELLCQVDKKVDQISNRYLTKPRHTLSPIPRTNPYLHPHSLNNSQFDTCPLPYSFDPPTTYDPPSRDIPFHQSDTSYFMQPTDQSTNSLKKSYDSTFDRNSPPSPLAPPDSILFEDPPDLSPPSDRRMPRAPERRHSPYTLPRTNRDMNGSIYPTEPKSLSTHSTASLLRLQAPDEHKIKLLEHKRAQEMHSHPHH